MEKRANALVCLHIPVTDLDKSTDFYVNRLGFTLERPPRRNKEGYANALLRIGNSPTIFLHETTDLVKLHFVNYSNTFTHAVLEIHTEHIEEFYNSLQEEGIPVEARYDNPGCGKYFDLYDPDGHRIKVCQDWSYFQ